MRKALRPGTRGSLIVAALLLFTLLLTLGLGLMASQSARMRTARAQADAAQAKALCLAAWQDVRVKLGLDSLFPPTTATQEFFAYSEDVFDQEGDFFGTYSVTVDVRSVRFRREAPDATTPSERNINQGIYMITCIGKVGERATEPVAERIMYYEVDMTTFNVIRVEDRASL